MNASRLWDRVSGGRMNLAMSVFDRHSRRVFAESTECGQKDMTVAATRNETLAGEGKSCDSLQAGRLKLGEVSCVQLAGGEPGAVQVSKVSKQTGGLAIHNVTSVLNHLRTASLPPRSATVSHFAYRNSCILPDSAYLFSNLCEKSRSNAQDGPLPSHYLCMPLRLLLDRSYQPRCAPA